MAMGTRIKLVMPTVYHRDTGIMVAPRLVVGDKEFKVVRTGYEYQGAIEVTIMVYANDLDIVSEEDNE